MVDDFDCRFFVIPLRLVILPHMHALQPEIPWLEVGIQADIDLPEHRCADAAKVRNQCAQLASKITVLALIRSAHLEINRTGNPTFAAITSKEIRCIDGNSSACRFSLPSVPLIYSDPGAFTHRPVTECQVHPEIVAVANRLAF